MVQLFISFFSPKLFLPLDSLTSHFPGSLLFFLPTFQSLWPPTISTLILNQQRYPRYLARFHFPLFTVTPKQFLFNFHRLATQCAFTGLSFINSSQKLWTACLISLFVV